MAEAGPVREATVIRDKNWEGNFLYHMCCEHVVFLLVRRHSMSLLELTCLFICTQKEIFY